jgi:hypothetical protein
MAASTVRCQHMHNANITSTRGVLVIWVPCLGRHVGMVEMARVVCTMKYLHAHETHYEHTKCSLYVFRARTGTGEQSRRWVDWLEPGVDHGCDDGGDARAVTVAVAMAWETSKARARA